jgi:hypothetical protein
MLNWIIPRTHRFHCPDEHQLAAYVDQQLIGAERERVESHLAKCDSCLQQVGFLVKESYVPEESAPTSLLHRAKKVDAGMQENAPFGWKWVTVAAASAVMAIGLLVWHEARPNIEEDSTLIATAPRPSAPAIPAPAKQDTNTAVRSESSPDSQPLVLSPQPGAIVHGSDFSIRWAPVPNASAYEVRIVTADGDLVWHKRVHENSVSPPKTTFRPGMKYFVWVRALLPDGKAQQSSAVGFIGG